jgi:FXSXX-COOH protein
MDEPDWEPEVDLVDLTGVSLTQLPDIDKRPFIHSLRRILEEADGTSGVVVAGHDSSI